jgi:hypothetical protein
LQRIDPYRLCDVLELRRAEIAGGDVEPSLDLTIGVLGKADRARLGDALQSRGDVDAVAHEVAVALFDDVAQMNADAEVDALVRGHARVADGHGVLDFDCAAHRVDHTAEFDDEPVAGALDDAAVVHDDGRIDQIAAQPPQARKGSVLVGAGEPAIPDDIRNQDRRDLPGLAHRAPSRAI